MDCKVSVSIITYNHEDYIAQAVESVLMQRTNFAYEILIGEDDSADRTREIVTGFKERYPDKIRLFLNDRKDVIYIDGKPTGRRNLVNNLQHARGQYVAWLEGDDYWTSPHKLQQQAAFLDSHPDCALCFHAVRKQYEEGSQPGRPADPSKRKEIYTIEDLFKGNFIASCSAMWRSGLFHEFPDWYLTVPMGDWPLHILHAQYGDIGYIDQEMAVHRVHHGGLWSSKTAVPQLRARLSSLETLQQHLGPQYHQKLDDAIAQRHVRLVRALFRKGDPKGAVEHAVEVLRGRTVPKGSLVKAGGRLLCRDAETLVKRTQQLLVRSER